MREILGAYAAGIVVLVLGTMIAGWGIGVMLLFSDTVAGIELTREVTWFRPAVLWGAITLICICATLCVGDMLKQHEWCVWSWPIIAVIVASVVNVVLGEPFVTPGALYGGLVALITVAVLRSWDRSYSEPV